MDYSIELQNIADKTTVNNTQAFNNQFDTENTDEIFSDFLTIDMEYNDEINFRENINSEDYHSLSRQSNFSIPKLKKREDENLSDELAAFLIKHVDTQQDPTYKADKLEVIANTTTYATELPPKLDVMSNAIHDTELSPKLDVMSNATHDTELEPLCDFEPMLAANHNEKYYNFLKQNITVRHVESKYSNNEMAQIVNNYDFDQAEMDATAIDNNTDIISNAVVTNNNNFSKNTEEDGASKNDFLGQNTNSSNALTDNVFSLKNNHIQHDSKVSNNATNISVFDNDFIEKFNNLQPEIIIEKVVKTNENFIIVKLSPEELGEVTFTVEMKDNIPQKIEAISESKDTLALIEKYATELKESLFKIGVSDDIAMEFNLGNNNNKQQHQQFQQTLDHITTEDDNIVPIINNYNIYQQPQHSSQINLIV